MKKICKQASNVRRFIKSLDEEQEKELEHELEEERQVERPPPMSPAVPHFDKKLLELVLSSDGETILADLQLRNVLHSLFSSLSNTHLIQEYANEAAAWADHLFVTDDFLRVLSQPTSSCDEYLRPVWWIGQIQVKFNKSIVVLFSSFECDRLKSAFRSSATSVLYMYRPKLSKLHNRLLRKRKLQITGMVNPPCLSLCDQVQIDMYAGSMYFDDEQEQDAYCNFLGTDSTAQNSRPKCSI
ncbi:hypothetical protein HA402_002023 [Bradysia odoriphaga]|nr:hypothetical protein HA402_002023 [Bradysia odoriphaga]